MLGLKKLDKFILKSFLMLFMGTFFICLFIFMMQFLWQYVDELVGKGLSYGVLAQFFFYSALTLVPTSMPLAILLASLMTFGNFGERYELLSMKAAGIPLTRIMAPLVALMMLLAMTSFFFQNVVAPKASVKLWTLLISIRQKSPELDIPEGIFYDQINKYNIYIKQKNRDTGMMYDMMIYSFADGFDNARIIVADSGQISMTADKKFLKLTLYHGEQFENLRSQSGLRNSVPYRRETFDRKESLLDFDSELNMVDGGFMSNQSMSKNIVELSRDIDSMNYRVDSIGRDYYETTRQSAYAVNLSGQDSAAVAINPVVAINVDSLFGSNTLAGKTNILKRTRNAVMSQLNDWKFKGFEITYGDKATRKHKTEFHRKITLSLACVIFFFIGAPLGAIIRRGGLGMPVIVSVLIFIFYYVIDNTGYKMARDGNWSAFAGMWISSGILIPIGAFLTYKSNQDSVAFNIDWYKEMARKLFMIPQKRHFSLKEVVIDTPDLQKIDGELDDIIGKISQYLQENNLRKMPGYIAMWTKGSEDKELAGINELLESIVEQLSNVKNPVILQALNDFPVLVVNSHRSIFRSKVLNMAAAVVLPVGLCLYVRAWIYRLRLYKDLNLVSELCGRFKNDYLRTIKQ
ncbi:MAG TPA: LptF/LptG family permease [Candidatus Avibacteroides excrementipullorum]|nr:LptF/LptG family permease [Candidatus Avibacteroides excrementipullorum]